MADDKDIADEGGGSKKKLIIIIAVVVLLLGGGGAAAFFLLGGDPPASEDGEGAAQADAPAVEASDPVYHKFDPVLVVNLPPGGPAGMLQIAIQVMTVYPSVVETLAANDPMLRHHLLNLLEQQDGNALITLEGKQALQTAVSDLLAEQLTALNEPGTIKGVYFTQFVMQ